jgi:hypothetical protein
MIKRGDKAKGFRFKTSTNTYLHWNNQMEKFIGVEGIVKDVRPEINEIVISFIVTTRLNGFIESHSQHWTYPLDEYIALQREMKLHQLGI